MDTERLKKQIEFVIEIDKLKQIFRQTLIIDGSREENDAEHSWHLAVMTMILSEYAAQEINPCHVIKMLLVHDLIEIDAGDTFCYDEKGYCDKAEREQKAAERLFALLPDDQAEEFMALWREFEDGETSEAKFAATLDRLQPLIHNYHTNGHTWVKHNVKSDKVYERVKPAQQGSTVLWEYAKGIIEDSIEKGYLKR